MEKCFCEYIIYKDTSKTIYNSDKTISCTLKRYSWGSVALLQKDDFDTPIFIKYCPFCGSCVDPESNYISMYDKFK